MFEDFDGFGETDSGDFVKFGTLEELRQNRTINRKIISKWISVFFDDQDEPYAIEMSCKHQGANLAEGKIVNNVVTCPRHFWKFNIVTGKSHTEYAPDLRKHAVRVKDGVLYVSIRPKP
ncbi:MAG: Rieske 2Fe-2S domain-containing protein [Deltaproteobacteria bacterium]|nr:Rieske 2Fe-2S domain-containing protein [Deltaproteobacteria bacterium]MBN2672399.1 Rieske 2Fe-2S domain-containing protein [Deltaproteobacteria bacterium]